MPPPPLRVRDEVQARTEGRWVVAAYAAALDLSVAGIVYDRGVDRLLQALAPHSGH